MSETGFGRREHEDRADPDNSSRTRFNIHESYEQSRRLKCTAQDY